MKRIHPNLMAQLCSLAGRGGYKSPNKIVEASDRRKLLKVVK
jgi:hypothetical protein